MERPTRSFTAAGRVAAARRGAKRALERAAARYVTIADAAARLGVSADLVEKLIASGDIVTVGIPCAGSSDRVRHLIDSGVLRAVRDRLVERYGRHASPLYRRLVRTLKKAKV